MPSWTKTVYEGGEGEITEKKSRFIATVCPVHSEEEALAFIEKMKKKYWDARHNCYAYILGENQTCMRSSDDGEPQGTAGHPMLDVLTGEKLYDVAVVVTRYFGGVLLGTGGLVKAYSSAAKEALENAGLAEEVCGIRGFITVDYNSVGKLNYILSAGGIYVLDTAYEENVKLDIVGEIADINCLKPTLNDAFAGRISIESEQEVRFYRSDGFANIL